jgi:hypothetical protein
MAISGYFFVLASNSPTIFSTGPKIAEYLGTDGGRGFAHLNGFVIHDRPFLFARSGSPAETSAGLAGEGSSVARRAQAAIARTGIPRCPGSRFGGMPSFASVSSVELYCTPIW